LQTRRVVGRLQPAVIAQLVEHGSEGVVGVDFEDLVRVRGAVQHRLYIQVLTGLALLFPERQHLRHAILVEHDPLAAKLHQRGLGFDQPGRFFGGHRFAAQGQLVAEFQQVVQAQVRALGGGGCLLAGRRRSHPQLGAAASLRGPPSGHDHPETGVFQYPGGFGQEGEGLFQ
jgi:hypothetical protein